MPGTLDQLSESTEYPIAEVLRQIINLRREGKRVNARMGARSLDGLAPTIYELASHQE